MLPFLVVPQFNRTKKKINEFYCTALWIDWFLQVLFVCFFYIRMVSLLSSKDFAIKHNPWFASSRHAHDPKPTVFDFGGGCVSTRRRLEIFLVSLDLLAMQLHLLYESVCFSTLFICHNNSNSKNKDKREQKRRKNL